jgi:oligopeptide transport system substrate-binding protein
MKSLSLISVALRKQSIGCLVGCFALGFSITVSAAAPTSPADPHKVLRYVFPAAETGFDPAAVNDLYSSAVIQSIFEMLYTYDYLARPVKLVPLTAVALPEVTDGGKTYTIHLKKGIYFTPDAAFGGKARELTMADYVYSFKRLLDPKVHSPNGWMLDGKIKGMDGLIAQAKKSGKFNYDAPIAGFELVDRYTLRIHLLKPDFNFGMILAHEPAAAVAREVIDKYHDSQGWVMSHPVGTGPYLLTSWVAGSKIILTANPQYRGYIWNFQASSDPEDQAIVAEMKGKRMPQIGRIEISDMLEDQSRWLAFQKDEVDLFQLEGPLVSEAISNGKLKPELVKKGIQLSRIVDPELSSYYWNMRDPILGGMSKEKIALRRAIAMAHDVNQEIKVVWSGDAVPLQYPIPPSVVGYDPDYKSSVQFEPIVANALLDQFGYKQAADGWRTLPDGKPLLIHYAVRAGSNSQAQAEMWKKTYDNIHIHMVTDIRPFPDLLKAEKDCQIQSRTAPWYADYPDGDNFMQLFYGGNIHSMNGGCAAIPEYDRLYEQSKQLPAGPERDLLYHKMTRILEVYAPMRVGYARYRNMLAQPRVIGFKKHPVLPAEFMYFDIKPRE